MISALNLVGWKKYWNSEQSFYFLTIYVLEEKFWVDDGCHKEKNNPQPADDFTGSYQSKSFLAGVRCCRINASGNSECKNLVNCPSESVTYDEAASKCKNQTNYDRLCTKDELLSEVCCGAGGQCNHHPVWTSTSIIGKYKTIIGNR